MPKAFPAEFRRDVVAVARKSDESIVKVAKGFGISESCLQRWLAQADVDLNDLDTRNYACSLRILLFGRRFLGRGLGAEATRMILVHAFEAVGLHRVELEVYAFNPRARHVYEKVGFIHEGTKRDALYWNGEWIDAYTTAVLAHEWAAHRGHP